MSTANNNGGARQNQATTGRGRPARAGARGGTAARRRGAPARK